MDPLRAMEIEQGINLEWWQRYEAYRIAQSKVAKEQERSNQRASRRR